MALKAWFCVEALTFSTMAKCVRNALASAAVGSPSAPFFAAIHQEAAAPVQVGFFRAFRIVPQADDLAQPLQPHSIVYECPSRRRVAVLCLGSTVLIAIDAYRIRRLLKLPRLRAYPAADFRQKQVQRLLKGVPDMRSFANSRKSLTHRTR